MCPDELIASACHDLCVAATALHDQGNKFFYQDRRHKWRDASIKADRVRMALRLLQGPNPDPVLPVLSGGLDQKPRLKAG